MFHALCLLPVLAVGQPTARPAPVPAVVAGPDLAEEATVVPAPIRAVTVYSDHARIARRAEAPAGRGVVAIRLPDLPGNTRLDTIRVQAEGARVIRVEAGPVQRNRASIDQVEGLLDAVEAGQDAMQALVVERAIVEGEQSLLASLGPAAPVDEGRRVDKAPPLSPTAWARVLDFFAARRAANRARTLALDAEAREKAKGLDALYAELRAYDQRAFSAQRVQLVALIDRKADRVSVALEYVVPGAQWTPVYRLERPPGQDRLTVRTAGLVTQTTGEDWEDVALTLSTAMPGRAIELPELLTWTLGESRDFLPRPQARAADAVATLPAPTPRPTLKDQEAARALAVLKGRMAGVGSSGRPGDMDGDGIPDARDRAPAVPEDKDGFEDSDGAPDLDNDADGIADVDDRCPAQPETFNGISDEDGCPDQGQARVQVKADRIEIAEKKTEAYPRPAPAAPPPMVSMDAVAEVSGPVSVMQSMPAMGGDVGGATRNMPLDLFDNRVVGRGPVGPAGSPAQLAGGLDYEYPAATRMSLPSKPEAQRVPLSVESYPITPYYQVAPALKTTAFLKATVDNRSGRPILGGPVNIFVGTDFVGQGQLATTGPGGQLELPLGADEDLKVVRKVIPKTVTEGVFSSKDVTRYQTVVEIGNYKKRAVKVRVVEQMPLTNDEDVQVKRGPITPKPVEGPDKGGLMAFLLEIPAGETRSVTFEYTLIRPENWRLEQR